MKKTVCGVCASSLIVGVEEKVSVNGGLNANSIRLVIWKGRKQ